MPVGMTFASPRCLTPRSSRSTPRAETLSNRDLATLCASLPAPAMATVAGAIEQAQPDELARWQAAARTLAAELASCYDRQRNQELLSSARHLQVQRVLGQLTEHCQSFTQQPLTGAGAAARMDRHCVLLVQANSFQRDVTASLVNEAGFASVSAHSSGMEALEVVRDGLRPQLVLCDIELAGEMNGYALLPQLKHALGGDAAIVLLVPEADVHDAAERCLVLDADSFVPNPPTLAHLASVSVVIERRKRTTRALDTRTAGLRQSILTVEAELTALLPASLRPSSPPVQTAEGVRDAAAAARAASAMLQRSAWACTSGGEPNESEHAGEGESPRVRKAVTFEAPAVAAAASVAATAEHEGAMITKVAELLLPLLDPIREPVTSPIDTKLTREQAIREREGATHDSAAGTSESFGRKPAYARAATAPPRRVLRKGDSGNLRSMMLKARSASERSMLVGGVLDDSSETTDDSPSSSPVGPSPSDVRPRRMSHEVHSGSIQSLLEKVPASTSNARHRHRRLSDSSLLLGDHHHDGGGAAIAREGRPERADPSPAGEEGQASIDAPRRVLCRMCESWVRETTLGEHLDGCAAALALRQSEAALNRELRALSGEIRQAPARLLRGALVHALEASRRGLEQLRALHELVVAARMETASTNDALVYHLGALTMLAQRLGALSGAGRFSPAEALVPEAEPLAAQLGALVRDKFSAVREMVRVRPEALDRPLPASLVGIPSLRDFALRKRIAKGGFGSVWVAKKISSGDIFALKVLRREGERMMTRVEELILKQHTSAFLVRGYYSFATRRHIVLALEYMPGGDLGTMLVQVGCLPEPQARFYLAEAVAGISYLHREGVVHHDVKPQNMLISASGHLKLTDFGLSAARDHGHLGRGTLPYAAPEVLKGAAGSSGLDMWALGVVLLELLHGELPFTADDPPGFRAAITQQLDARGVWEPRDGVEAFAQATGLSLAALDLCRSVLVEDASRRATIDVLRRHAFFGGVVWDQLERMEPPFVPVLEDASDTSYFEATVGYSRLDVEERISDESTDDETSNAEASFVGGVHADQLIEWTLDAFSATASDATTSSPCIAATAGVALPDSGGRGRVDAGMGHMQNMMTADALAVGSPV